MTIPPRLQFTNLRTRHVEGRAVLDLMLTAEDDVGRLVKLPWIEMTPEDAQKLAKTIQQALEELGPG